MKQGDEWTFKNEHFPETVFKKGMKRMSTPEQQRFMDTPISLQRCELSLATLSALTTLFKHAPCHIAAMTLLTNGSNY